MHFDLRDLEPNHVVEGDICIVGAGAAGITLALEFEGTPCRVVLLEGGGFEHESKVQDLYRGVTSGQPYYPLPASRLHYFGGTTGLWGGQCSPLDEIDFAARPWIEHSGWPLKRTEFDPYYIRAHKLLGLGAYDYRISEFLKTRSDLAELLPPNDGVFSKLWRFVPPALLNFGHRFKPALAKSKNIHLYTYANATKIQVNETAERVTDVLATNHAGRSHLVRAKYYILSCCGLQNARLLLASHERATAGLGNDYDHVGRYFMEHIELKAGELWLREADPLKLYQYRYAETAARAELAIHPAKQAEQAILNGTASLTPLTLAHEIKPMIEIWSDEDPRKNLARLITDREKADVVARKLNRAQPHLENKAYELFIRLEQSPNRNSRVTLDAKRDSLGMPRAKLHWELTSLEKHSLRQICHLIGRQTGIADVGRVRLLEYLWDENDRTWPSFTGAGWHHIGTTRMSGNPKTGVVNRDCRLHGTANLYIAGSSCFPTSGAANPTFSILALTLRLADHLKQITLPNG